MKIGKASAPAKVILFGEHFVVYGSQAILASINRRVAVNAHATNEDKICIRSDIGVAGEYSGSSFNTIEGGAGAKEKLDPLYSAAVGSIPKGKKKGLEIEVASDVPPGIGLGSSAAACVATVAAVKSIYQKKPSRSKICELAIECERMIHKNSSGADCHVSTFGGLMRYSRRGGFAQIKSRGSLPLVLASTGVTHSTGDLVAGVKKFRDANEGLFKDLENQVADICTRAQAALASGRRDRLGTLMNENQAVLRQIGVSHYKVDDLVDICIKAGALGSKLTGAGGGGAVIALAASKHEAAKIASRARAAGYESFEVQIDLKGLA